MNIVFFFFSDRLKDGEIELFHKHIGFPQKGILKMVFQQDDAPQL